MSFFSGEEKRETTFDVLKYEVRCLFREGHTESIILHAIRQSLKGQARRLLLTMSEVVSQEQIIEKLEGVFGNVYRAESLLQQCYMKKQQPNQTVAEYGMKLESMLQPVNEKGHIGLKSRNDMLRSRFWLGLHDIHLGNARRHKFDTVWDFDRFKKEIREIKLD